MGIDWTAWATVIVAYFVICLLTWLFNRDEGTHTITHRTIPILLLVIFERVVHIANLMAQ